MRRRSLVILRNSQDLTVKDFANLAGVTETEVIKRLFMKGIPRTVNQMIGFEHAYRLANEFNDELNEDDAFVRKHPVKPEDSGEDALREPEALSDQDVDE